MNKLPQITLAFWVMKICATTLGETAGDLLSMTLDVGYAASSLILISLFLVTLFGQLATRRYNPWLYWLVILSTSTAGTTMSDFMDRTLGLGYASGSAILVSILIATFALWRLSGTPLAVGDIRNLKGELFYWVAILFSNTLGTALGDFLADDSGLGFAGGALLIGSLIAGIVVLHYFTRISSVLLFWLAFVLTRPFGATLGDVLTKSHEKGGLDFGTIGSSAVLAGVLVVLVVIASLRENREERLPAVAANG
ncbi:COG4705 family protein [Pseudomonas knackmussii]|uniref:COG4705 family protein n=1 Tax=Pseudomonas knackmussii TaxID=65741 RepID=UPI003F4A4997